MKNRFYITLFLCAFVCRLEAASLKQSFDVKIGLFDAAKVDVFYDLKDSNYLFKSNISTSGMFDNFYSFKAEYVTSGIINKGNFITQDYHQATKSSAHLRTKRLIFDKNGRLTQRQSSKDQDNKTVDIELPLKKTDIYDIQSVLLMMIKQFGQTDSCEMNKTVFNGKKIYHISLKDGGRTFFNDKKVKISGDAHKCSAFIHQDDAQKGDLLWQVSAERAIVFYLMKDKKTGLVFVPKIEIGSTPLGDLKAYLTDLILE